MSKEERIKKIKLIYDILMDLENDKYIETVTNIPEYIKSNIITLSENYIFGIVSEASKQHFVSYIH